MPDGIFTDPFYLFALKKEEAMWIVYLVVGLVGLVFGVLSLLSLEPEA